MRKKVKPSIKDFNQTFVQDLSETQAGEVSGGVMPVVAVLFYSGKSRENVQTLKGFAGRLF